MLVFLIEKEFKQIIRHSFIPKLLIVFPVMVMLVFPWAATMEIKNISINITDLDHSTLSKKLVQKISASNYFRLTGLSSSHADAIEEIEFGNADILLEIKSGFEKQLIREGATNVSISSNAVNGAKGGLGAAYLSGILQEYTMEQLAILGIKPVPVIKTTESYLFNPMLNYKIFIIPAIITMLLTMLCGFLPALNIVGEKEAGTMEQINVTPVPKFSFILAKLIPYWIIGVIALSLCFALANLFYGLTPSGSISTIYIFAAIFLLVVSGLGLIISNYSSTLQQAMFVMFFFMMIMILISGLFTPVSSMPKWAQLITMINPLKYFIQVMRAVYLKGSGMGELTVQMVALIFFAVGANIWAVISYRKTTH
ncbi:MAG: ABC transporter permease [Prevotellaceae bacterium]|jgi:ABC-2 type transport system permease protein|nr:ABC transporter permease [Prevotellaceae bacterium]